MSLLDQQKSDPEAEDMRSAVLNLLAIVFPKYVLPDLERASQHGLQQARILILLHLTT